LPPTGHVNVVSNVGARAGTLTSSFHHSENANRPVNCGPLAGPEFAAFRDATKVSDALTLQSHFGEAFEETTAAGPCTGPLTSSKTNGTLAAEIEGERVTCTWT